MTIIYIYFLYYVSDYNQHNGMSHLGEKNSNVEIIH